LILGDLVEDERTKRCGPDCDLAHVADELAGWGPRDVIDGYAAACTLAKAAPDPELARRVAEVYAVDARDAVCAVATAPQRGASIPNAVAGRARAVFETRQREAAAVAAAAREAQRTAQLKQREEAARVASEQAAASAATSQLTAAADKGDYATMLELVRKRRRGEANAAAADAVLRRWDELIAWIGGDTSIIGAYLELADATRAVAPPGHALLAKLDALRTRALADVKRRARGARGVGGAWLYAALAEKIAGPGEMVEAKASAAAFAKLTTAVRPSLVIDRLARACAPIRPEMTRGKTVRVASTLTCTIEPEKTWTTTEMVPGEIDMEAEDAPARLVPKDVVHRAYKLIVHGDLAVTSGGPRRVVPIDIDDILDDGGAGDETDTYEAARAKAMATIRAAVLGPIEAADAEAAYAAGQRALAVKRTAAAEDALVRHALLVGASPELDQLLTPYAVAFPELLPANR
jgi:hypothetical protein